MKLKEKKGLLPEKKENDYKGLSMVGNVEEATYGYNQAISELAEKEIELDVEKIYKEIAEEICGQCREQSIHCGSAVAVRKGEKKCQWIFEIAQALSKAKDILKLKGEK